MSEHFPCIIVALTYAESGNITTYSYGISLIAMLHVAFDFLSAVFIDHNKTSLRIIWDQQEIELREIDSTSKSPSKQNNDRCC